jgi:cytochrome c oxidase assembly protein subunit 19
MTDAFGGSRVKVKPPERGVFPLDHEGECRPRMVQFLECLKKNKQDHFPCKELSKSYLQCRMDHELMAKEDMGNLGFGKDKEYVRVDPTLTASKEAEGFVAGIGVKSGKGWNLWK